jgi:hypothetical protein
MVAVAKPKGGRWDGCEGKGRSDDEVLEVGGCLVGAFGPLTSYIRVRRCWAITRKKRCWAISLSGLDHRAREISFIF